ncbi:Low conductance mechanosensitive channel YnaI [Pedobacter sp. Bi27]|uniref:mechanosensitive ion channel family protein n=1 Tax=unclassified Pedobacter TaxID=2628915 RepID=UPI001DA2F149|nr:MULTISPECIES: mechanosensitive ion channel family protein [unclassified Pedobacter]CAH0187466.1 Low conductance mechanosensitive channel YnaI [Pedobacter sp. Bi36]CAH0211062.1 Low conductance mechanosensitive channel YnaI [Pedobacter sp. Bi27]CAH0243215.1 Low conductance mechanosensitive channel YnaI [Pedobacter sp. Bi126]
MLDSAFFDQVFWGNTVKAYFLFGGILFLGLVFKNIVSKLLSRLLFKLFRNFSNQSHNDAFVALLVKPIEVFILLTTLYLSINQLKHPLEVAVFHYSKLIGKVKELIPVTIGDCIDRIFLFGIILSVFWIILRIIDFISHVLLYKASLTDNKSDDQLVPFLKELFKTIVIFIGFFTLLGFVFEVNVLTLITGLGIGGIAIALAAKESLENLIGSFTIFLDKPFTVGDLVKVDGVEGTVEKVGFRSTRIRTSEKTMATIPNRGMIDGVLENLSLRNSRKVSFIIGLTYETNSESLRKIITEIESYINNHQGTSDDGNASFKSFGDSGLNVEVNYFVTVLDYAEFLKIRQEINLEIMDIVIRNKSDFAYPTQRLISDRPAPAGNNEEVGNDAMD